MAQIPPNITSILGKNENNRSTRLSAVCDFSELTSVSWVDNKMEPRNGSEMDSLHSQDREAGLFHSILDFNQFLIH